MALAGTLCILANTVVGFANRSLRAQVSGLLGGAYTAAQMTYDLRRLPLKGLIRRIERTNRYVLTPDGIRVAVYTKLHNRLLSPLLAADGHQVLPSFARPCASSTGRSTTTSTTPAWGSLHEMNLPQLSRTRPPRKPRNVPPGSFLLRRGYDEAPHGAHRRARREQPALHGFPLAMRLRLGRSPHDVGMLSARQR
jgi:hypothetical protein